MWFFWAAAAAILLILLVIRVQKLYKFWKNRGVPSKSPKFFVGDLGKVLRLKSFPLLYDDLYKTFAGERMVGFYEFTKPSLLVRDPRLIESILIKDFSHFTDRMRMSTNKHDRFVKHLFLMRGTQWKDLRAKLVATFTPNKMRSMAVFMDRCADIMISMLREKCDTEEDVDMKEIISRFATDVIGCCVFGLQFNTLKQPDSEFRKIGQIIFKKTLRSFAVFLLGIISPKIINLLNLNHQPKQVETFFENLLRESEKFRQKELVRRADLMQLILDVRDQDRANAADTCAEEIIDDAAVLSNMMLFYAAGFETTASTLSFCLYELALHPELQDRLRLEIRAILEDNDGVLTYDNLKLMTFAEMVICETLRKYSPASFLKRVCTLPYQLAGTSCVLQPDDEITISVHSLHHDEKYYPNPEKFDPYRFAPENIASRPPQTFIPFGNGPRICLAIRFAKMEMKLCLARLLSQYKFSPGPKTEIPLTLDMTGLVVAKNGIHLRVSQLTQN